jgi:MOSC domain-containing protein
MNDSRPLGTLAALWRYPVKSLAPEPLTSVTVTSKGLAGDRGSALFVNTPEHARAGKTLRGKEQPRFHTLEDREAAYDLARDAALDVEVREDGPYFDAMPVSLVFDRWLDHLGTLVGFAPEPLRFRPNLLVRATDAIPPEVDFVGRELRVGSVVLRVAAPIVRCVTPTYDLLTGESNAEFHRILVNQRGNLMGIYCTVEQPGEIAVGDEVREAP